MRLQQQTYTLCDFIISDAKAAAAWHFLHAVAVVAAGGGAAAVAVVREACVLACAAVLLARGCCAGM